MTERPDHWPAAVYDHPLPQRLRDIGAGLVPPPATDARRHHYVPKLVLRGFESRAKPKHVHQMDKSTGTPVLAPIGTAAAQKRLYAAPTESGGYDNTLEGLLALIESHASGALRLLLDDPARPTEDRLLPLPFLMALQVMRTPTALDLVGEQVEGFGEREFAALLADSHAFARTVRSAAPGLSGHEIEQLRRDAQELFATGGARLRLDNHRAAGLEVMITKLIDAALTMAHADWTVLVSSSRELIVNDVGYARVEPRDGLPVPSGLVFPFRKDAAVIVAPPTSPTEGSRCPRGVRT